MDTYTLADMVDLERASGVAHGPAWQQWTRERAPEQVKKYLQLAAARPDLVASRQGFMGMDVVDAPPASHAAYGNSSTKTNLWAPNLWMPIPAADMKAGKVYKASWGGIIATTATPTINMDPMIGTSATPASNLSLGIGGTVTLGTISAGSAFYGEFTFAIRQIGVAAAGATATGNGFNIFPAAAGAIGICNPMGSTVVTTLDQTIAQGFTVAATWGTLSASNTMTVQWTVLQSLN